MPNLVHDIPRHPKSGQFASGKVEFRAVAPRDDNGQTIVTGGVSVAKFTNDGTGFSIDLGEGLFESRLRIDGANATDWKDGKFVNPAGGGRWLTLLQSFGGVPEDPSALEALYAVLATTYVRSVNGVPVDEDGDVQIEAGGLDPAALAAELNNPETAANSAVVGIVSGVVPTGLMPFVNAMTDLAAPRPVGYSGPVVWMIPVGSEDPVHKGLGDLYAEITETVISWTPAQLPNLHSWFDAQAVAGIADGSGVAQWNDLSGLAHHALQATGANQPLYRTTGINGHPALEFDGTDILLTDAFATSTAEPWTVYMVAQSTPATTTSSDYFFDALASNGTTPTRLAAYRTATNTLTISRGTAIATPPTLDNAVHRLKLVFNGTNSAVKIGDTETAPRTTALSGVEVARLALGGRADANASNLLIGFIGEIVFVKGAVSVDDDALITEYLQAKWDVA